MADVSTKTTVQGGALLDALSKFLFKGIESIFDAAVEYKNEMGVLKQVTTIPVKSERDQKKYTLTVKLTPIKDKEGNYYIELECPDYPKFKPGALHGNVVKLNKDNQKDFIKLVDQILDKNGLERVPTEGEAAEEEKKESSKNFKKNNDLSGTYTFLFHSYNEEATDTTVTVVMDTSQDGQETDIEVTGDPKLAQDFFKRISHEEVAEGRGPKNLGTQLDDHMKKKCRLFVDEADKESWQSLIDSLNKPDKSFANESEATTEEATTEETTAASIKVTLEKVIGSDQHEYINLVSIDSSCSEDDAMTAINAIVASDEFVDQMPEGESSYEITEEDDDYDVTMI